MSYNNLTYEIDNRINIISINRPKKLNALNIETFSEIDHAIKSSIVNPDVRLIIITGTGDKAFVAGADIKEFVNFSMAEAYELSKSGHKILSETLERCPKPIIAAINGYAFGGGTEIALACHIRLASKDAIFAQPEVKLGLIPGWGGTQRLPRIVGKGIANEMIISGKPIDAEEAYRVGLVNKVYKKESLMSESLKFAKIF